MEPAPIPVLPRPRWHPLVRALLFVFTFIFIQTALGAVFFLVLQVVGGEVPPDAVVGAFALTAPPLFMVTLLFLRTLDRRDLASIGARWPEGGRRRALRQAVSVPLATLALLGIWLLIVEALPQSDVEVDGLSPTAGFPVALLLVGFLIQGGIEEWIFRGYVYRALKERWPWWGAALASSIAFGLMHAGNSGVTVAAVGNTMLAGFLLCLLVERSGSLWSATLAHAAWNFSIACLISLPVSGLQVSHLLRTAVTGPGMVTGGGFGPEGSLILTALALPLVLFLWPQRRQLDVSSTEVTLNRPDLQSGN
jgi:membrane protease YdiL (CAAX protease family)